MNKKIIIGVILLLVVALIILVISPKLQTSRDSEIITASFSNGETTVDATFNNKDNTVTFNHEALGTVTLNSAVSASGARYANEDESIVFWEHQGIVTITQNDVQIFEGAAVNELSANTWIWEKTTDADNDEFVPEKTDAFTLKLGNDNRVSGTTDCNGFFSTYVLADESSLVFGPIGSTKMYCEGSQEFIFTDSLSKSESYEIKDSNLFIKLKDNEGVMQFKKQ